MSNPHDLFYTREHEWARIEDHVITVGITDHAQEALGDIVFVELPEIGQELEESEPFGVVESVKAVSELFAPCEGVVVAINDELADAPEQINSYPYDDGWLIQLEVEDPELIESRLMSAEDYELFLEGED
ncbi:MAG: glycine cleavage system protein GcvH [Myxococcota bacterium]|nr:glycine cleavage system protein GcvH [Myxococcota bacterium]